MNGLTEDQLDRIGDAKDWLYDEIEKTVKRAVKHFKLDGESEELLRVQLGEEYRFWERDE